MSYIVDWLTINREAVLPEIEAELNRREDQRGAAARDAVCYTDYADDPVGFVRNILGDNLGLKDVRKGRAASATAPWRKQIEIMEAVRDHKRVVVRAAHSVGKTHIAARVALWFLYTHTPAICVTTAPKATQVRDLLWGRLRAAFADAGLPGRCLTTRCEPIEGDPEWYAVGYTARDAEAFQGYHEAWVLLILDEAPGVPAYIHEACEGMLSGANTRILMIGNPTERSGPFYQASRSPIWHSLQVSAWEHPNVDLKRLYYAKALAPTWPQERLEEWGEQHPLYLSRVLGEFPDEGEDTLIPLSWIEAAIGRPASTEGRIALGVDVARYGMDETVFVLVSGRSVEIVERYQGKSLSETTGRIMQWLPAVDAVAIDDGGLGGGVVDAVIDQATDGAEKVLPINNGEKARENDDFADAGAEMMWALRQTLEAGYRTADDSSVGLVLPDDSRLIAQLSGRKYEYTLQGKIRLESKDKMRTRGEPSPDRADALALAHWAAHHPPRPARMERVYG